MEAHLPNKFHLAHQKCNVTLHDGMEDLTYPRTNLVAQQLKCCFGHSDMPERSRTRQISVYLS